MSFQSNYKHVQLSTKCRNKRDAEAYERAFRTQLAKGEVGLEPKKPVPAFSDAVAEFLAWSEVEHRNKPKTIMSYKSASAAPLSFFGNKPLDSIQANDIEKFKEIRGKERRKPRTTSKKRKAKEQSWKPTPLRPATINRELALLKMIFNFYIRRDVLVKNPVSQVKLLAEDNCQMRVVTQDEERLYLMAASQPLQDFATVMIDTGMRPEEVARIERRYVNFDLGFLLVPFGKTKAARRKIPLTARVGDILQKRSIQTTSDFLFSTEKTGNPLTTLKTSHATTLRRSSVPKFRLYDLLHTFATRFIEAGGDIVTLQALLGHSNIQMVTRYAHPTEKHQFDAIRRMEAVRLENTSKKAFA